MAGPVATGAATDLAMGADTSYWQVWRGAIPAFTVAAAPRVSVSYWRAWRMADFVATGSATDLADPCGHFFLDSLRHSSGSASAPPLGSALVSATLAAATPTPH